MVTTIHVSRVDSTFWPGGGIIRYPNVPYESRIAVGCCAALAILTIMLHVSSHIRMYIQSLKQPL